MKTCFRFLPACLLAALVLAGSLSYGQESRLRDAVQLSHDALFEWLATTPHHDGWHNYLQGDSLKAQLELADKADTAAVAGILKKYSSGAAGLERPRFAAVRRALEAWRAALAIPSKTELPLAALQAVEEFAPLGDTEVADSKRSVQSAARTLGRYLRSVRGGQGWLTFLKWEDLERELAADEPDVEVLGKIEGRFASGYDGLEKPRYHKVAVALTNYLAKLHVATDVEAQQNYQDQCRALAANLKACEASPSAANLEKLAASVDYLERRGQAPELMTAVRRYYWRPNLLLQVTEEVIVAGFRESVDEEKPVNERDGSTRIRGTQHTVGAVVAELVPNGEIAEIRTQFDGNTAARTTSYPSGATIRGRSATSFNSYKKLFLDKRGFHDDPAFASARTKITILSVQASRGSQYNSIARDRVRQRLPESQRKAARRAEDRIEKRLNDDLGERLADANADYKKRYRTPLLRRGAFPDLHYSSTKDHVRGVAVSARPGEYASPTAPPEIGGQPAMSIRMHDTAFNNTAAARYAGQAVDRDTFNADIERWFGSLPDRFKPEADDPNWEITFAQEKPITLVVTPQTATITFRATRFKDAPDAEAYTMPMNIKAVYKLSVGKTGLRGLRQGDLEVLPPNFNQGSRLSGRQTAMRRVLLRRFEQLLEPEIEGEGIELTDRWAVAGTLRLESVASYAGWLALGWKQELPPADKTAATPATAVGE